MREMKTDVNDDLKSNVVFQLSVAEVLDKVYAASAMTVVAGVKGENGVCYGAVTRDHERLLLTMVEDACSGLAIALLSQLQSCRLDDAGRVDGKVDFVLRLPAGMADGMALSLRRRMEAAVAFNVLEHVWLGHDKEMVNYYRGRALGAAKEVKECIRLIPVGPLRLVSHW